MKFDVKAAANQVAFSFNQNKPKILMIGGILGVLPAVLWPARQRYI